MFQSLVRPCPHRLTGRPSLNAQIKRWAFEIVAPRLWNGLLPDSRSTTGLKISVDTFKTQLKTHLFRLAFVSPRVSISVCFLCPLLLCFIVSYYVMVLFALFYPSGQHFVTLFCERCYINKLNLLTYLLLHQRAYIYAIIFKCVGVCMQ